MLSEQGRFVIKCEYTIDSPASPNIPNINILILKSKHILGSNIHSFQSSYS